MRLWEFALAAWGRPGVEAASLTLQDEHGQCVPLVLWRAWAVAEGRAVPDTDRILEVARYCEGQILAPLRATRRAVKAPGNADIRKALRASELAAERDLLEALEELTPVPTGHRDNLARALSDLAFAWNGARPAEALAVLAERLGSELPPATALLICPPDGRPDGRS
ncbi:MAG TPA: TIGR02444 family protein [Caulobacteraceae bacterium]